jgi:DNA polymerase III epsilon subunit-like protein
MRLVFLDTETTGLPKYRNASALQAPYNWPDIVSVAWIVYDKGQLISSSYALIKPQGWVIGPESTKIHGITQAYANEHGSNMGFILNNLANDLKEANVVIGHNLEFDRNVLFNAYKWQLNLNPLHFWPAREICTMLKATDELKIPSKFPTTYRPYKPPSLLELYEATFPGRTIEGQHNAEKDVEVLTEIYWKRWK